EQLLGRADVEQDLRARKLRVRTLECSERTEVIARFEQTHAGLDERFGVAFAAGGLRERGVPRDDDADEKREVAANHWISVSMRILPEPEPLPLSGGGFTGVIGLTTFFFTGAGVGGGGGATGGGAASGTGGCGLGVGGGAGVG